MTAGKGDSFDGLAAVAEDEAVARIQPTLLRGEWVREVLARGEYVVLEKRAGGGVMLDVEAVRRAAAGFGLELVPKAQP